MITWPNTMPSPAWPLQEEYEDTSMISKFEDGSQQSRSKFTRSRRKWTLQWSNIDSTAYRAIMLFVKNNAKFSAVSFQWTIPDTSEVVTVRITSAPAWSNENLQFWSGNLEFTEV